MPQKVKKSGHFVKPTLDPIFQLWGWILLAWSLYRHFFNLPEWADELVFKPLIFVIPVLWYVRRIERKRLESVGITSKNLFNSLYIGLGFGLVFAVEGLLLNISKNSTLVINPIQAFREYGMLLLFILSLATAVSEEILNRGFLFTRIFEKSKSLYYSLGMATLLFVLLHVPALVTTLKLEGLTLVIFFLTTGMLGFLNNLLMYNTRSIVAPILVHVFWNMTVALFF
ncbi:hypothetical protein A2154_03370 [Candidatus Gottesmanbacteria bacterium RBG_16_43_7]|uniref:CAAX prenyl protease 2/Lysostaphin resistance protein A-like domain-containing protein n=1 Tax=Candidatus Gottesmanbacteria bacterium RBG_16_43_7 TaxID=1798373 RepID=A0A1F5Z9D3_9BACT|nr:MAG: hypothetical protein A2154_03370 [Candidatus Gottesmanbacteria bacterium RBG_16_43_7]